MIEAINSVIVTNNPSPPPVILVATTHTICTIMKVIMMPIHHVLIFLI